MARTTGTRPAAGKDAKAKKKPAPAGRKSGGPAKRKSAGPADKRAPKGTAARSREPAVALEPEEVMPAEELDSAAEVDAELDLAGGEEVLEAPGEEAAELELSPEPAAVGAVTSLARAPGSGPLARVSPLQRYLSEVRQHPLLSREEEQSLAEAYYRRGDREAGRTLVSSNLRLVVKIALEYYRHWMDLLDLIQEGNLGLVQAVKKFDPYRGIRLSTYSSFWIRAYILKFLMDNWRLVKIGTTQAQRKLFFNLKKEKDRLEQLGFKPGARMLAQSLEVKESEVVEMEQRLSAHDESIDLPLSEDGKQTRESVLADERPKVDHAVADDEFAGIIRRKLTEFREGLKRAGNEKELFIFEQRLMSESPLTLQEVGDKFQVSRERVRQLEARLLKNLKEFLKQEMPDFEDYDFVSS